MTHIRQSLFALIFIGLGIYGAYWIALVFPHPWAEDFAIYYRAFMAAAVGESAYYPYNIGAGFVYLPASLSVISFLSLLGVAGQGVASILWATANIAGYMLSIVMAWRLFGLGIARQKIILSAVLFLSFAPFLEMVYIGQINGLVIACLVGSFYFSERNQDIWAGVGLGIAILLKTSPVIFLGYYIVTRRFKVVAVALTVIFILSGVAYIQFGLQPYKDFLSILPLLGGETHPNFFNHSIPGTVERLWLDAHRDQAIEPIMFAQRIFTSGLMGLALLGGFFVPRKDKQTRGWLFGLLLCLMTIASPLVWYHHNVFLLFPLILLIYSDDVWIMMGGVVLISVIQAERLYEVWAGGWSEINAYAGLPVIAAQVGLVGLIFVLYALGVIRGIRGTKGRIDSETLPLV